MNNKFTNRIFVAILLFFGTFAVILLGCEKQTNVQSEKMSDEQIIKAVLAKPEYTEINKNLLEIIKLSKVTSDVKANLQSLNLVAKNVNSLSRTTEFLKELGVVKYDEIVGLNYQNFNLFQKIIKEIPGFKYKNPDQISTLFDRAYSEYESNNSQTQRIKSMDICSSGYATGMGSCGNQLALELATAGTAGAAGAVAGSPLAGGILFFGGVAIAYLHERSCRQDVVSTWSACRAAHPLH